MKKTAFLILAILLTALMVLVSCGISSTTTATTSATSGTTTSPQATTTPASGPQSGGTLTLVATEGPGILGPPRLVPGESREAVSAIYDTLFKYQVVRDHHILVFDSHNNSSRFIINLLKCNI